MCFWAESRERQGTVSAADTSAYPSISTLTARADAFGGELKSELRFFRAPSMLICMCFPSLVGSLKESRPSGRFKTFDKGANSADFRECRFDKSAKVDSAGCCSSCKVMRYRLVNAASNKLRISDEGDGPSSVSMGLV